MNKIGWPAPELAQDDCRGLFRWFASKPDARLLVRQSAEDICCNGDCREGRDCPLRPVVTPEDAGDWTLFAAVVGSALAAFALFCAVAVIGAPLFSLQ